jgi:hypothetical protein
MEQEVGSEEVEVEFDNNGLMRNFTLRLTKNETLLTLAYMH